MRADILARTMVLLALAAGAARADESAWSITKKAVARAKQGDTAEAERLLESAVALDPRCGEAWYHLGTLAEKRGAARAAAERFGQVGEESGMYALAQERLGTIARRAGELERALAHFLVLAAKRPGTGASIQVATTQLDLRRHAAAEATLTKAAARAKGDVRLHELFGRLYVETGRHTEAVEHYETILAAIPRDTTARCLLATCHEELGRRAEALREVRTVLEQDPYHAIALRTAVRLLGDDRAHARTVEEYRERLRKLAARGPRVRPVSGGK